MAAAPVSNLFRHVAISIDTWELIINNRFDTYEAVRKYKDLETSTLVWYQQKVRESPLRLIEEDLNGTE